MFNKFVYLIMYGIIGYTIGYTVANLYFKKYNVIYHGPDSNEVKKKIFYWSKDGKYYKFIPIPYVCPPMYINALKQKVSQKRTEQQLIQHE